MELWTGWLSPKGELIECKTYYHTRVAEKLIEEYHYTSTPKDYSVNDIMMRCGWIQITRGSFLDHDYHMYWSGRIAPDAFAVMKEWFEDEDTACWISSNTKMSWEMECDRR